MPYKFRQDVRRGMGTAFDLVFDDDDRAPDARGWLRRPQFDHSGFDAWEAPDGLLIGVRRMLEKAGVDTRL